MIEACRTGCRTVAAPTQGVSEEKPANIRAMAGMPVVIDSFSVAPLRRFFMTSVLNRLDGKSQALGVARESSGEGLDCLTWRQSQLKLPCRPFFRLSGRGRPWRLD